MGIQASPYEILKSKKNTDTQTEPVMRYSPTRGYYYMMEQKKPKPQFKLKQALTKTMST